MEIKNCLNAVNAYKSIGFEAKTKEKTSLKAAPNTDVVEFTSLKDAVMTQKAAIAKSVDTSVGQERINALTKAVSEGTYYVSDEKIAMSMLG